MKQAFAVQKKKEKKEGKQKKNKSTTSTDHDPVCIFFLCMRQNPFVSLVVFGLGFSKSKQDAKHRGRVRAGPSVLWPTKGERNVFPHDTGIKIVDFLQQWHIISSLGLVFSSFFFPDLTGLITSVLICYWLLLTRTSRWCKSKPVWTCPSFQTYRKKEKKKTTTEKPKSQAIVAVPWERFD